MISFFATTETMCNSYLKPWNMRVALRVFETLKPEGVRKLRNFGKVCKLHRMID